MSENKTFNLLTEPWIPVRDKQNNIYETGILDVFQNASELVEITDNQPHQEFAMYRLLMTILMDIYRPRKVFELEDMIAKGSFDQTVITDYFAECEKEGVSFDLFDEKRPFLQVPVDAWDTKEPVSIAALNPICPSGNNHIHFNHTKDYETAFSYAEAARALPAIFIFCTAAAKGYYSSSVNGAPPIYTIVKGNNLFETLVYGMAASNQFENYDKECVLWKSHETIEGGKKVAETSLLRGLIFPTRRITLIPSCDENVKKILFDHGLDYSGYASFVDPYVSYETTDEGRSSKKPKIDVEPWRNLATIFNCDANTAPLVVKQYREITERNTISVNTYHLITKQGAYLDSYAGEFTVPMAILKNDVFMASLQNAITVAEENKEIIGSALKDLKKELNFRNNSCIDSLKASVIRCFYAECGEKLLSEYIPDLNSEDTIAKVEENWKKMIRTMSLQAYDSCIEYMGIRGRLLMKSERIRFRHFFSQKKEKGKNNEPRRIN